MFDINFFRKKKIPGGQFYEQKQDCNFEITNCTVNVYQIYDIDFLSYEINRGKLLKQKPYIDYEMNVIYMYVYKMCDIWKYVQCTLYIMKEQIVL